MVHFVATLILLLAGPMSPSAAHADAPFRVFLDELWPEAQRVGVSRAAFVALTRDLEPDLSLPDLIIPGRPQQPAGQPEFERTPAEYMAETSLARLATQGRRLNTEHQRTLLAIERQYGVPPTILLALWGRETAYGTAKLPHNAIRALATQAYLGRRKAMFREQFVLALKMVQEGHVRAEAMRASWAGAMGLTQFLPSDFYRYAVDMDGDGRRDIFTSVPDALGSTARQLVEKGWERGKSWGFEVRVPANLDCTIATPDVTMTIDEWEKRGFAPVVANSRTADKTDRASLFLPSGHYGPAFLTMKNFYVLKDYNFADLYALFVGHLGDRIGGGPGFATPWGHVRQSRSDEIAAMQTHLTRINLYADKIDGKAGMKTRAALGAFQKARGLKVDCWPDPALLPSMGRDR